MSSKDESLESTLNELISVGFTEQDAILAIGQSQNDDEKCHQPEQTSPKSSIGNQQIEIDMDDILNSCMVEFASNANPTDDLLSNALNEFAVMQPSDDDINIEMDKLHSCNLYPHNKCSDNTLTQCSCLGRICGVLLINVLHNDNIQQTIYDNIGNFNDGYSNIHLLNDFNHLIHCHSTQFEDIYNILLQQVYNNKACNLSNCLSMKRNERDRIKTSENVIKKLYFTNDENQIATLQFIDRIHCHYFHSFDIGHKISREELQHILNEPEIKNDDDEKQNNIYLGDSCKLVSGISRLNRKKRDKHRNIQGLQRIYSKNNKYMIHQQTTLESTKAMANKLNNYRFGFRFFYHNYYRNNSKQNDPAAIFSHIRMGFDIVNVGYDLGQMYVAPKYNDFQEELKDNDICHISAVEWNSNCKKAKTHIETYHARTFKCPRNTSAEYYDMKYGDTLTMEHVIAMMVYCNFDTLQRKFTETFRRMSDDESIKDIKQRHSNYHFLAKLLRECVECFGMEHNGISDIKLFSGINQQFKFDSIYANIRGPLSTTRDYAVAVNFSAITGMILELNINVKSWLLKYMELDAQKYVCCFDTQWLSDYSNEAEILCLGGLNRIEFTSIIDVSTGKNYGHYVKGLKQMTSAMESADSTVSLSDIDIATTAQEKQMVFRLLAHQFWKHLPDHKHAHEFESLPPYFEQIMDAHCKNIVAAEINKKENIVLDMFTKLDNGWINLDIFTKIFPNIKLLDFYGFNKPCSFFTHDSIYESILTYIKQHTNGNNYQSKLIHLEFEMNKDYESELKRFVKQNYELKFNECGWEISIVHMDPVQQWFQKFGNVKELLGMIKGNPILMELARQTVKSFECILHPLAAAAGINIKDFDIARDYDKLSFGKIRIKKV